MRSVDDLDDGELEELKAEGWMVELISLNPDYVYWGPHEDYMSGGRRDSWNSPVFSTSWKDFQLTLDELNECVNFYFEAERASKNCETCGGEGFNPETRKISDIFYDFKGSFMGGKGSGNERWCDKITLWEKKGGMGGHDGINRHILIRARAKRLGVYGMCPECEGKGHIYTADKAVLTLVLWILHPRKGCSRGWEIKDIQKKDTQAILTFLREAADRNFQRFQKAIEFGGALKG